MNNKFNKSINEIKKIVMTAEEKRKILDRVLSSAGQNSRAYDQEISRNHWSMHLVSVWLRSHTKYSILGTLAIVVMIGGGVITFAHKSLPGDSLYGFKVKINEPVREAFTYVPRDKAELLVDLVDRRMIEGETLAAQGRLDEVKQAGLSDFIIEHTEELNSQLSKVAKSEGEKARDISLNFRKKLDEHTRKLSSLDQTRSEPAASADLVRTFDENVSAGNIPVQTASREMKTDDRKDESKAAASSTPTKNERKVKKPKTEKSEKDEESDNKQPIHDLVESARKSSETIYNWEKRTYGEVEED